MIVLMKNVDSQKLMLPGESVLLPKPGGSWPQTGASTLRYQNISSSTFTWWWSDMIWVRDTNMRNLSVFTWKLFPLFSSVASLLVNLPDWTPTQRPSFDWTKTTIIRNISNTIIIIIPIQHYLLFVGVHRKDCLTEVDWINLRTIHGLILKSKSEYVTFVVLLCFVFGSQFTILWRRLQ